MDLPDNDYTVIQIPVHLIYADENFNCRGIIPTSEVIDLAQDIQRNKLQFPIAVQPVEDVKGEVPDGKQFRIVAGHRRFKGWSVLRTGWKPGDLGPGGAVVADSTNPYDTLPCMVKVGLTEVQARILNLGENLKRKDLNIMQEATAIKHLHEAGVPRDHVADELGVSSNWVQVRYNLMDLPEDIQKEAAAGLINQLQIKQLYSIRHDEAKLYESVRKIKEAKNKGEQAGHVGKKKLEKTNVKKERKRVDIFKMIEILATSTGYGLHTRTLAWASGQITTDELFQDVREFCERTDRPRPRLPEEF